MSDNSFFKELFEREFSRLLASGVNKQSAAAQALVSAQSIVTERHRYQHPIPPLPSISSTLPSDERTNTSEGREGISTLPAIPSPPPLIPIATLFSSAGASSTGGSSSNINNLAETTAMSVDKAVDNEGKRRVKPAATMYRSNKRSFNASSIAPKKIVPLIRSEELQNILQECVRTSDFSQIIRLVGSTFSSAESLNESFCFPSVSSSSSSAASSSSSASFSSSTSSPFVTPVASERCSSPTASSSSGKSSGCAMTSGSAMAVDGEMDIEVNTAAAVCSFPSSSIIETHENGLNGGIGENGGNEEKGGKEDVHDCRVDGRDVNLHGDGGKCSYGIGEREGEEGKGGTEMMQGIGGTEGKEQGKEEGEQEGKGSGKEAGIGSAKGSEKGSEKADNAAAAPPSDRISIDIDEVSAVFQLLFGCGSEGVQNSLGNTFPICFLAFFSCFLACFASLFFSRSFPLLYSIRLLPCLLTVRGAPLAVDVFLYTSSFIGGSYSFLQRLLFSVLPSCVRSFASSSSILISPAFSPFLISPIPHKYP